MPCRFRPPGYSAPISMWCSRERVQGEQVQERRPSRTVMAHSRAGRSTDGRRPQSWQDVVVVMPLNATDAALPAGYGRTTCP